MKKKKMREDALRAAMLQEAEMSLISEEELERVSGSLESSSTVVSSSSTSELTCKCWCATGLLSTCYPGTISDTGTA